jgi:polar amino acid transport system substrate-binding protein
MLHTKHTEHLLLFAIALSMLFFVFAGCSSTDGQNSLDKVLKTGKLTVAGSGGYPPFNYYEGDEVVGFDVDTGAAIAERLGVELNYVTSDWDGLIDGLTSGSYDAILGSMAINQERLAAVNFTIPYYYSGAQLVVRKDSGLISPDDMEGKTIGVASGTTFEIDAEKIGARVSLYQDDTQTLTELINGRISGVITDRLVALQGMNEISGGKKLTLAGELLRLEEMAIAVKKEDAELLEKLNEILSEMHDDGTLTKISMKWQNGKDITVK